ncbi:AaceriAFR383Cp [[Ashbya] aceris (nom. inval.)]|nr:AaceriAFR383Cp [[Ashbya] aceris (nom. inval.)]
MGAARYAKWGLQVRRAFHGGFKVVEVEAQEPVKCACESELTSYNGALPPECRLDTSLPLPSQPPAYNKHVLLVSPSADAWISDWQSKIELNPRWPYNSVSTFKRALRTSYHGDGILVNAVCLQGSSFLPKPQHDHAQFLVLPEFRVYEIRKDSIEDFAHFIGGGKDESASSQFAFRDFVGGAGRLAAAREEGPKGGATGPTFQGQTVDGNLLLVCGHLQRDARCGLVAPKLMNALEREPYLAGTALGIVSHIGGHKLAGNLIFYSRAGVSHLGQPLVDALWFGKVLPAMVPTLVAALAQKKIISSNYRGGISF